VQNHIFGLVMLKTGVRKAVPTSTVGRGKQARLEVVPTTSTWSDEFIRAECGDSLFAYSNWPNLRQSSLTAHMVFSDSKATPQTTLGYLNGTNLMWKHGRDRQRQLPIQSQLPGSKENSKGETPIDQNINAGT